jgi:hypothetical protein
VSEPEKIKDLQYSFSGFLWKNLDKIQQSWDEGDPVHALWQTLSLVNYLPVVIKNELEPYAKQIAAKMNRAAGVESSDFHTSMLSKNRANTFTAERYLPWFINKMMRLLDDRGYLERGTWQPIVKEDFKKLEGEGETNEG